MHYAKFVEGLKDAEEGPGCEHCTDNRLLLEHAWQVVANEFYDPAGHFSQAKWADQLLHTFEVIPENLVAIWQAALCDQPACHGPALSCEHVLLVITVVWTCIIACFHGHSCQTSSHT